MAEDEDLITLVVTRSEAKQIDLGLFERTLLLIKLPKYSEVEDALDNTKSAAVVVQRAMEGRS